MTWWKLPYEKISISNLQFVSQGFKDNLVKFTFSQGTVVYHNDTLNVGYSRDQKVDVECMTYRVDWLASFQKLTCGLR
jgi:hypothetical protein